MPHHPDNPLIIQSDRTLLLEVQHPRFREARDSIAPFSELVKSPEYVHVYRITPLTLWNAASNGMGAEEILSVLSRYAKYGVPEPIVREVRDNVRRYGLLRLISEDGRLWLVSEDPLLLEEIGNLRSLRNVLGERVNTRRIEVRPDARGRLKQELVRIGYPVEDLAGYAEGERLPVCLLPVTRSNRPFRLRDYQEKAVESFYADGSIYGGSGVLVLPCGAGKTIVGLGVMARLQTATLILTTNVTSVRQWIREILDKTGLEPHQVGEYTGERKEVRPVTVATYQILTHRPDREGEFPHLSLFRERNWGLIIYDEVHLLPAPIFRITAEIQAKRRLGLTATLVREDGREEDVFSLIGPKKADIPWKDLEQKGWIAAAECIEIRLGMGPKEREAYVSADSRQKYRLAAENPRKLELLVRLLEKHRGDQVLIIGQYIGQLEAIAQRLQAPLITGKTPQAERDRLYEAFKRGENKVMVVSRVANFAIDLPDANVAVQVSGTFGSRQEEAQRLGRILRPKPGENKACFYSLVTRDSRDQEFALHRQLFLVEQGYQYRIMEEEEWVP